MTTKHKLPTNGEIKTFLVEFFRTDVTPRYLLEYNEIVANHFKLSQELRDLKQFDAGTNPHSEGDDTELGARVGRIISQNLKKEGVVKLVLQENTYEGINGPHPVLKDSSGIRAAKTRAGLSEIYVSIRILRDGCRMTLDKIESLLTNNPTGTQFDPELIRQAIKDLKDEPVKPY